MHADRTGHERAKHHARADAAAATAGVRGEAPAHRQRVRGDDVARWIRSQAVALWNDRGARQALAIVIGGRLVLGVVGWATIELMPPTSVGGDWTQLRIASSDPLWPLISPWERWDALWYQHIAMSWYADTASTRFFPLYPGLVRVVGLVLGGQQTQYALAQLLISTVALFIALVLLRRLVAGDVDEGTADRSMLYIAVSPLAVFLFAGFSESVFLATTVGALLAARRRRWIAAAVVAALAVINRPPGVLIMVPLVVEMGIDAWHRRGRGMLPFRWSYALVIVLPALAVGAYYMRYLAPIGGFIASEGYLAGRPFAPPWTSLHHSLLAVLSGAHPEEVANFVSSIVLLATIPLMAWRLPWSYTSYAIVSVVPIICRYATFTPLASAGRYVLVVFPVFVVFALAGRWAAIDRLITVIFPVLLGFEMVLFARYVFVG